MNRIPLPGPVGAGGVAGTALAALLAMTGCHRPGDPAGDAAVSTAAGGGSEVVTRSLDQCNVLAGRALGDGIRVAAARVAEALPRLPAACVAQVAFEGSALRFQARLPLEGWNGRMVFIGGGGFDGMFMEPTEPYFSRSVLDDRYAVITTNGGYDYPERDLGYFQAAFAADRQKLEDFTHASEHRSVAPARSLVQAFYGREPARSYFEGCSMGGHDALIQAQRYPDDFDGIVARAPAGNVMGLMLQFNRIATAVRMPGVDFGPGQAKLLADAVRQACPVNGDGVVADALRCGFDPESLRCTGATSDRCLTDAQMEVVIAATTPFETRDGRWRHPGFPFSGGEDSPKGWGEYLLPNPALGGETLQGLFSDGFLRSFIARNPQLDTRTWDWGEHRERLGEIGDLFNATDPDLRRLHARGAKLILANGTMDTSVSARDTAQYYERVVELLGQDVADETVELFLMPGVGHCAGGPGADEVDLLAAMSAWVEEGVPPSEQGLMLAKRDQHGQVVERRTACRHPLVARGPGEGSCRE